MQLLFALLTIYGWLIIIRVVFSWVSADRHNPIVVLIDQLTEPALRPLRKLLPSRRLGGTDLSPFLALVLIQILKYLLWSAFG